MYDIVCAWSEGMLYRAAMARCHAVGLGPDAVCDLAIDERLASFATPVKEEIKSYHPKLKYGHSAHNTSLGSILHKVAR